MVVGTTLHSSQGYEMVLWIDANGCGEGKGTHVSFTVYLREGEFDKVYRCSAMRSRRTVLVFSHSPRKRQ